MYSANKNSYLKECQRYEITSWDTSVSAVFTRTNIPWKSIVAAAALYSADDAAGILENKDLPEDAGLNSAILIEPISVI